MAVDSSPTSLDPRTLAKLKGLQLRARRIVEGYLEGLHRSPYRGFSIEFAEHREYAPGDDLRYLDWKVFARTDKLYLKQFEDETNLICQLVVDVSESMSYRGPSSALSKFEFAQCLAVALAWLVLRQHDAVGLVTVDREIREQIAAGSNAAHLQHIVRGLESTQPQFPTAVGPLLAQLAGSLRRRGIVIVISDLFDNLASLMRGLQQLRLQRHDVMVLQLLDRAELDFPFERPTLFKGLEQWREVFVDPRRLRQAYQTEMRNFCRALQRGCREHGIDFRTVRTDQPLDWVLSSLLSRRMRRVG